MNDVVSVRTLEADGIIPASKAAHVVAKGVIKGGGG